MSNTPAPPDDEHEFHYNPQCAFPNFADYGARRQSWNAEANAGLTKLTDLAYGDHPLRTLDLFLADGGRRPCPVHVFIHGGYWRAQDKQNFAFVAPVLVARGITVAVINYELCPASTLDGVVDAAIAAVEWLHRTVAQHGGDPDAISISGHSAGAHLCAEVLAADWAARGINPGFITGAVMISGIFDPAPAMRTTVNAQLRLTPSIAARHDVERRPPRIICPIWLFAGGQEPWRWIDQTFRYAHHLHRHVADPAVQVLPGFNHFDVIDQYRDASSPIGQAVLASAGVRQGLRRNCRNIGGRNVSRRPERERTSGPPSNPDLRVDAGIEQVGRQVGDSDDNQDEQR